MRCSGIWVVFVGLSRVKPSPLRTPLQQMRRQIDDLDVSAVEKTVTADEQHIGPLAPKAREGRIDLAAGAGVKGLDLQSHSARSGLSLSRIGLGGARVGGIDQHAPPRGPRRSLRACRTLEGVPSVPQEKAPLGRGLKFRRS